LYTEGGMRWRLFLPGHSGQGHSDPVLPWREWDSFRFADYTAKWNLLSKHTSGLEGVLW